MIDTSSEQMMPLKEVPAYLQRNGRRLHLSAIYRWTQRGLNGVRLETAYHLGVQSTSVEAIRRFDERLTIAKLGASERQPTEKSTSAAHQRAMKKLGVQKEDSHGSALTAKSRFLL